ncbi:hypothetical protein GCM10022255_044520 [Dactylosporangium darangshiense]|uniref:Uncharacterized protein n=3 Tax=Dactylosporangium darangshiense TaxID=579108 RepID=A0ABP8DAU6_9ACTN
MRRMTRLIASALVLGAVVAGGAVARSATASASNKNWFPEQVHLKLTPSTPQLAACMPNVRVNVDVQLTTERLGFDTFTVNAFNLPPNTTFTVFLLQQAGPPFGAAEYIGDFTSDWRGRALNSFKLIVQEAFSSTLVNGQRTRVDLNQVGAWFADPAGDDFCLGPNSPVTPFDGDGEAGVQAFNSANTTPLPAP